VAPACKPCVLVCQGNCPTMPYSYGTKFRFPCEVADRWLHLFWSKMFAFHHVPNICESPGQKPGFRLGGRL
jgi:hypothetical protein